MQVVTHVVDDTAPPKLAKTASVVDGLGLSGALAEYTDFGVDATDALETGDAAAGNVATGEWRGNEPGGLTQITERSFQAVSEGGWWAQNVNGTFSQEDGTSPEGDDSFGRMTYPTNMEGGGVPGSTGYDIGSGYTEMYNCFRLRFSANFYGHPVGLNKIAFWAVEGYGGAGNPVFLFVSCNGSGSLSNLGFQQQGPGYDGDENGSEAVGQNMYGSTSFSRDAWVLVETYVKLNTDRNFNGTARLWLNGALDINYTDVRFVDTDFMTGPMEWTIGGKWEPTWGGYTGVYVPSTMWMDADRWYMSGA